MPLSKQGFSYLPLLSPAICATSLLFFLQFQFFYLFFSDAKTHKCHNVVRSKVLIALSRSIYYLGPNQCFQDLDQIMLTI